MNARKALSVLGPVVILALGACAAPGEDTDEASSANTTAVCGNGVREVGEQCDDGNTGNLDGCSKSCGFEQVQRMNTIEMMFGTDQYCTANALGGAIKGVAQGQIQDGVANAVNDGKISILATFPGLSDMLGASASTVTVGSLVGDPHVPGAAAIDGWYTPNPQTITPDREPVSTLTGSIQNSLLNVTGNLAFSLNLGGQQLDLRLSAAKLQAKVGPASTPKTASATSSPGHLPSENVDPTLKTFETMSAGEMCGNVTAASLAAIPVPEQLTSGSADCSQGYTVGVNSMLDVFVGGCKVFFVTALAPTQPDKLDPSVPVVGAGAPYTFQTASNRKVTGCKDKSGGAAPLDACLKSAAYSAAFKFTTQRVVIKN